MNQLGSASRFTHANNFDFLRLVAALMVLYSHQFALTGRGQPQVFQRVSEQPLGTLGVCIFFAISGYLVTKSWTQDPHILRFTWRRLLRIWPALAVVTVITVFVLGPLVTTLSAAEYFNSPITWRHLKQLQFNIQYKLPGVFAGNPYPNAINGSLWTIPVELRCYAVVLVVGALGLLRWRALALLATIALAVFHFAVYGAEWNPVYKLSREYTLFFLSGACLWLYRDLWVARVWICAAVICAATLACVLLQWKLVALWLAVPFFSIVFGAASTPGIRSAGRYGDASYGIYIWAFPVQQLVAWWLGAEPFLLSLALSTALTVTLGYVSWHLIEQPALRFKPSAKRALQAGRDSAGAAAT